MIMIIIIFIIIIIIIIIIIYLFIFFFFCGRPIFVYKKMVVKRRFGKLSVEGIHPNKTHTVRDEII